MVSWWKKTVPTLGVVIFRGDLPDRVENYRYLEAMGITITPTPGDAHNIWGMQLHHPDWGEALVLCPRNFPKPPDDMQRHLSSLRELDREVIRTAGTGLLVSMEPRHNNVLRDRKFALRYLHALMGVDGVVAVDVQSQLYWTPDMLADELCHDADLDVEALYSLHELQHPEAGNVCWIHSHGLQEIGFFDFSLINPAPELPSDLYRSLAYAIVEGTAKVGDQILLTLSPRHEVVLASMRDFLQQGDPTVIASLDAHIDTRHREHTTVLCEPQGNWLRRLFIRRLSPSRALTTGLPDHGMLSFSTTASNLMAERARGTYAVFRNTWEEFFAAGLPMPILAKIGYVVDHGGPHAREHLWFEVKGFAEDALDAVLVNEPHSIARMKLGDRGMHALAQLSDWVIMTPVGPITPRNASPARVLRSLPSDTLEAFRAVLHAEAAAGR